MSVQRARIADAIAEAPGIHFSELVRRLDLAPGQVQYHVTRLRRRDDVLEERLYGRTHFYPPSFDEWERGAVALLRRESARDVVTYLLAEGPAGPAAVAEDLDLARSTVEWHVGRLAERGLVEKRRDERNRVTLVPARPADTVRLLAAVDPSLPDRLVDRFARLVDSLLAD